MTVENGENINKPESRSESMKTPKREDFAVKRLRRLLREFLQHRRETKGSSYPLSYVLKSQNSAKMKIAWAFIFVISITMCLVQTTQRINYYLSYPIAVDVNWVRLKYLRLPEIIVCSTETDESTALVKNANNNPLSPCILQWKNSLSKIDVMKLWTITNISSLVLNANIIELKTGRTLENLKERNIYSPFGVCSGFKAEKPVQLQKEVINIELRIPKDHCLPAFYMLMIQEVQQATSLRPRDLAVAELGLKAKIDFQFTKYNFINSPSNPCVSSEIFWKCLESCLISKYINTFSCRFPFVQALSNNMSLCESKDETVDMYEKAVEMFLKTDAYSECHCKRVCKQKKYSFTPKGSFRFTNVTSKFTVAIPNRSIMVIKERLAYDFISLLCDCGGNLGLYLGISILSFVEIIYLSYRSYWKCRNHKYRNLIYRKISALLEEEISNLKNINGRSEIRNVFKCYKHGFKQLMLGFCWCIFAFHIYCRVAYFFSFPTKNIVQVEENSTILYPSFTICSSTRPLEMKKRAFGKRYKITNWCKLELLDLIGFRNYTSERIWNNSDLSNVIKTIADMSQILQNLTVGSFRRKSVVLSQGICEQFNPDPQIYLGTYTAFIILITQVPTRCKHKIDRWAYLTSPEDDIVTSPHHGISLLQGLTTAIVLRAKRIKRYNRDGKTCVDSDQENDCLLECLKRYTLQNCNCRLPFMPVHNISECNNAISAKESFEKYMRYLYELRFRCNCKKKCQQTIYFPTVIYEKDSFFGVDTQILSFANNIIESVIEMPADTLVKLFCDIGATLGFMTGISLLSVIDLLFYSTIRIANFFDKINKN